MAFKNELQESLDYHFSITADCNQYLHTVDLNFLSL